MDRLVTVEPQVLALRFTTHTPSFTAFELRNVMHTMRIAFLVQPLTTHNDSAYHVNPALGILPPLGTIKLQVGLVPSHRNMLVSTAQFHEKFVVHSVVVTGTQEEVDLDWFTSEGKQVFHDSSLAVLLVGADILNRLMEKSSECVEEMRKVLEIGRDSFPDVADMRDEHGRTPLHVAISRRRPDVVQLLLEFGADVEGLTPHGSTPLQESASAGDDLIMELLLAKGASTWSCGVRQDRWTPLHCAASGGHARCVELLLNKRGNHDEECDKEPAFSSNGHHLVFLKDNLGCTPLHRAVDHRQRQYVECTQLLLQAGADANACARGLENKTPLHIGATHGDIDTVCLLLDWGANINVRTGSLHLTPFDLALPLGNPSLLDLLRLGDDMRYAARQNILGDVQQCIEAGASNEGRDQHGWTALHRAAFKGNIDIVKLLLDSHAQEVDPIDDQGYTPLHCAIEAGHKDVARLLLLNGANPNALSKCQASPLHLAHVFHELSILQLLLEWGAIPTPKLLSSNVMQELIKHAPKSSLVKPKHCFNHHTYSMSKASIIVLH